MPQSLLCTLYFSWALLVLLDSTTKQNGGLRVPGPEVFAQFLSHFFSMEASLIKTK